jgi:L-seryl-tRNA(Ser) seleniumtransferase
MTNLPSDGISNPTGKEQMLRALPSVQRIVDTHLRDPDTVGVDPEILTKLARTAVDAVRMSILAGNGVPDPEAAVAEAVHRELRQLTEPRLKSVINATGVIIHTNLGRAPVSIATSKAMSRVAGEYTPLELELSSGKRGGRMSEISRSLRLLTGAESSLVVNNNAAAVLLVLSALCTGREVILSRSQAVEIGGGFRIPDVLRQSGARLIEVGTTNRTYARDYEREIGEETGALLTVHWSNFKIVGFTSQPSLGELAQVAHRHDRPLIEDLGSGSLIETHPFGLSAEPTVTQSIEAGVDVVCFSGDKLLGGPQAGIISGSQSLVDQIAAHPLARAVRADKTALAGIAETLRHYVRGEALEQIPVWQMISATSDQLHERCLKWHSALVNSDDVDIVQTSSAIGGGSLPGESLPSWGLSIASSDPDRLARLLRNGEPAIMPHIEDERLILDARTVLRGQDDGLVSGLNTALSAV